MKLEDLTLADVARLLAAVAKLKADDPTFVQQVIAREEIPPDLPHPRITLGSLFQLLAQTGGSTVLAENIVAMLRAEPAGSVVVCGTVTTLKFKKRPPQPEDFEREGVRVRLRRDSKFSRQNSGLGTVIWLKPENHFGWVRVRFSDGYENNYRTGRPVKDGTDSDGTCDLELAEPLAPASALVTIPNGHVLEIPIPPDRGIKLGDIVAIDLETKQLVTT